MRNQSRLGADANAGVGVGVGAGAGSTEAGGWLDAAVVMAVAGVVWLRLRL